ncbi:MAG: pyridoxal phosphate-dependent aminotransferase [Acidobacteria bacterium]|nr:pyridoxal phosphate-dependent aminotransferase [Acidobacteriota bacterium]
MKFSSRFHWDMRPNRLAELLAAKRAHGVPILDLTESNPTRAGLDYPLEIVASLADTRSLVYDPQPAGMAGARAAVAAYYGDIAPERILLTASTSEAYSYLFKLLTEPDEQVLVPRPSYPLFDFLAALEWVRVAQYPLEYHGEWTIDFPALEKAITKQTRAIVVVNPNNPTGSYLKRAELDRLAALCAARNLAIVSDEVFADYALRDDPRRVRTLAYEDRTLAFVLSGLSKIAGLPQMKLGWIVTAGPERLRQEAFEKLEWIADTYLSVGTPVQYAAANLLAAGEAVQGQIAARARDNLEHLRAAIGADSPFRVLAVEGGWYAVVQAPRVRSEEEWALELLGSHDVLVQPGFFYDFPAEAYLVISLLTAPGPFREGVRRLLNLS